MLDPLHMACNMMWLILDICLHLLSMACSPAGQLPLGAAVWQHRFINHCFVACSLAIRSYRNQTKVLQYEQDNCWLQDTTIFSVKVDSQLAKSANA